MGTKTISIMDDVYKLLKAAKAPNESFSAAIRKLVKTKGSIMEFAGAWSDIPEKEANKIKSEISKMRKGKRFLEIRKT